MAQNNEEQARPNTRQELYDRIRTSSKDEYILQDMVRLGYWESNKDAPSVSEQLIKRESELMRELSALLTERRRVEDQQALLKELRKQRMLESRKKREENKLKREQQRKERAENWQKRKQVEILYLGKGVSEGLNHTESNIQQLSKWKLPVFHTTTDFAKALDVSLGEIRFLSFHRDISKTHHYKRFFVQKKAGGTRLISAPMPRLKKVQKWILENVLNIIEPKEVAHGFVRKKSIVTNARPHVGADVVINMDLKDFFPSITYNRVKGVFSQLGYSEALATTFALICTQADVDEAELDTETWYIANGERFLPQGASTSPAITNILCQRLDNRLVGISKKLGFTYTRYADDLTFSATGEGTKNINALKENVFKIIDNEGFTLHPDKLRIMRKGSKKEVTGVVVNKKTSVDRTTLRKFRALLHNISKTGLKDKKWGNSDDLEASIQGYANYVAMIDPEKGKILKKKVKEILNQKK